MFRSDEDGARTEAPAKTEASAKTIQRICDSDGDFIYAKPSTKTETKDNTKDIIKTKPSTKTKTKTEDNIYTRIKFECKECHEELRNKTALNTHSYSHNRVYLENTERFDINSGQNMREFYINDKGGNYIEDVVVAINKSLEEIKNCYQYRKIESFKYKIKAECEYKKRTKDEVKITKYSSTLTIFLIMLYMNIVTSPNG